MNDDGGIESTEAYREGQAINALIQHNANSQAYDLLQSGITHQSSTGKSDYNLLNGEAVDD